MLTRMGWKEGRGLGYHEDGASTSPLSLEDKNGCNGFGLRHVSDRCTIDPTAKFMESWEIGKSRTARLWKGGKECDTLISRYEASCSVLEHMLRDRVNIENTRHNQSESTRARPAL